jgi:septum formation protein
MIILASQSPRRKEILAEILGEDVEFKCVPSHFDETKVHDDDVKVYCLKEAMGKGEEVSLQYPDDITIASDTMVAYQGQLLGKPKDHDEALHMLQMLSGNVHEVVTAYVIRKGDKELKHRICVAHLFIEKMADAEIEAYLDTGSPYDKAGGYGVQDTEFINSKVIDGEYFTIMGLPAEALEKDLLNLGIIK